MAIKEPDGTQITNQYRTKQNVDNCVEKLPQAVAELHKEFEKHMKKYVNK